MAYTHKKQDRSHYDKGHDFTPERNPMLENSSLNNTQHPHVCASRNQKWAILHSILESCANVISSCSDDVYP